MGNAQAGKFDLDGLLQLSNIDIQYLGEIGSDLNLSPEEKQLLDVLKDYEKRAREKTDEGTKNTIEGDRNQGEFWRPLMSHFM